MHAKLVCPDNGGFCPIPKFNAEFHVISCGEAVYLLQPVPKFPLQVSKPSNVISPFAMEPLILLCMTIHLPPSFLHVAASVQLNFSGGELHTSCTS